MKNKMSVLLFSVVLCLCTVISAFVAQTNGFANEYECIRDSTDIVVPTINTLDRQTLRGSAGDIYGYYCFDYGESRSCLLLIAGMEDKERYMSAYDYGITAFANEEDTRISKKMKDDLSDGNRATAFNTYVKPCDEFITKGKNNILYDETNLSREPLPLIWIPISVIVGTMLSFIVVGKMKDNLRTARFRATAGNCMKDGSLSITERRDLFLYNTVTRTEKPKSNSSGRRNTHTSSPCSPHGRQGR